MSLRKIVTPPLFRKTGEKDSSSTFYFETQKIPFGFLTLVELARTLTHENFLEGRSLGT